MPDENVQTRDALTFLHGWYDAQAAAVEKPAAARVKHEGKIVDSLEQAILLSGLKNGMTISFHHHFRNGDHIVNMVLDKLEEMGCKDLTLAASSLTDCHAPVIGHIKSGLISRIETSGMRGELAEAVSDGLMNEPVVFRSHGGRAGAIESGEMHIDAAFLGVPSCDMFGNSNGYVPGGESGAVICGSLGYGMVDARCADKVIAITDFIAPYPNTPCAIPGTDIDYIVISEDIGESRGIMSGATRYTKNPRELLLAERCTEVIEACGLLRDGFSMQMGSGGATLAVARFLRERMLKKGIKARFALGGITGQIVEMHEEGLIEKILDVQSFDLKAAASVKDNAGHCVISAAQYAGPSGCAAVDALDFVVLSALEIDTDYNVNVLTGADGVIRGAMGGHPDTAEGAKVSIVAAPLIRGRISSVVEHVDTIVTQGKNIDILVTDHGVAVNPRRPEIVRQLSQAGIKTCDIHRLKDMAFELVGVPERIEHTDRVVGLVRDRHNNVVDKIYQVK